MFNFIFKREPDGKYKAMARIVHNGEVYGTDVIVDDNKADTVMEAFVVLHATMRDTIEVLNEQENESSGDTARG